MRYVMLLCGPESAWDDPESPEAAAMMERIVAWSESQREGGHLAPGGQELDRPSSARTIRAGADGKPLVTDGPYLEAKEVLGGFVILEYDTMDQAVEAASEWLSIDPTTVIEVRPVLQ
jgi:hypothetical protein